MPLNLPYNYRFSGSASPLALSVSMCDLNRGYSGHLDFIIDLQLLAKRIKSSCVRFVATLSHVISRGVLECVHGIFAFWFARQNI